MNRSRTICVVAVMLVLLIVLTSVSVSATQNRLQLEVDNGAIVNVAPGNVVWERIYGGLADDRAFNMLPVNNGFLLVGSTKSSSAANVAEGWALMLDSEGNAFWNRTFLLGAGTELRYGLDLTDGFLLIGNQFTASNDVNGYVARVNADGALLWETVMGGDKVDKLFSGATSVDGGGFALFGLTHSYGGGKEAAAWIVYLDDAGNVAWNNTYISGFDCALRSGVAIQNGGFAVAGYLNAGEGNYDFLLLKVASDGALVWNRTIGGEESQKAYSMTIASDGYVLVGESTSTETSTDAWVVKVDFW